MRDCSGVRGRDVRRGCGTRRSRLGEGVRIGLISWCDAERNQLPLKVLRVCEVNLAHIAKIMHTDESGGCAAHRYRVKVPRREVEAVTAERRSESRGEVVRDV